MTFRPQVDLYRFFVKGSKYGRGEPRRWPGTLLDAKEVFYFEVLNQCQSVRQILESIDDFDEELLNHSAELLEWDFKDFVLSSVYFFVESLLERDFNKYSYNHSSNYLWERIIQILLSAPLELAEDISQMIQRNHFLFQQHKAFALTLSNKLSDLEGFLEIEPKIAEYEIAHNISPPLHKWCQPKRITNLLDMLLIEPTTSQEIACLVAAQISFKPIIVFLEEFQNSKRFGWQPEQILEYWEKIILPPEVANDISCTILETVDLDKILDDFSSVERTVYKVQLQNLLTDFFQNRKRFVNLLFQESISIDSKRYRDKIHPPYDYEDIVALLEALPPEKEKYLYDEIFCPGILQTKKLLVNFLFVLFGIGSGTLLTVFPTFRVGDRDFKKLTDLAFYPPSTVQVSMPQRQFGGMRLEVPPGFRTMTAQAVKKQVIAKRNDQQMIVYPKLESIELMRKVEDRFANPLQKKERFRVNGTVTVFQLSENDVEQICNWSLAGPAWELVALKEAAKDYIKKGNIENKKRVLENFEIDHILVAAETKPPGHRTEDIKYDKSHAICVSKESHKKRTQNDNENQRILYYETDYSWKNHNDLHDLRIGAINSVISSHKQISGDFTLKYNQKYGILFVNYETEIIKGGLLDIQQLEDISAGYGVAPQQYSLLRDALKQSYAIGQDANFIQNKQFKTPLQFEDFLIDVEDQLLTSFKVLGKMEYVFKSCKKNNSEMPGNHLSDWQKVRLKQLDSAFNVCLLQNNISGPTSMRVKTVINNALKSLEKTINTPQKTDAATLFDEVNAQERFTAYKGRNGRILRASSNKL